MTFSPLKKENLSVNLLNDHGVNFIVSLVDILNTFKIKVRFYCVSNIKFITNTKENPVKRKLTFEYV